MDMGRFLIEMHLRTGKPIKELARTHEVSPAGSSSCSAATASKAPPGSSPEAGGPSPRRPASPISTRTRSWPCARS